MRLAMTRERGGILVLRRAQDEDECNSTEPSVFLMLSLSKHEEEALEPYISPLRPCRWNSCLVRKRARLALSAWNPLGATKAWPAS